MQRKLYIASYDIRCNKTRSRVLNIVRDFASGGQYSCYECYLNSFECKELLSRVEQKIDPETDGFILIALHSSMDIRILGVAVKPIDPDIYIVG